MNIQVPTKQMDNKKKAKLEVYVKMKTKAKDPVDVKGKREVTKDTRPTANTSTRLLRGNQFRKI